MYSKQNKNKTMSHLDRSLASLPFDVIEPFENTERLLVLNPFESLLLLERVILP